MDTPRCRHACGWIGLALALFFAGSVVAQNSGARLANISTRGQVGTDADNLFGGFVISGGSKTVLVRAVGPGLAAFGVGGTLADPVLNLFDARNTVVATNNDWNAADAAAFAQVGAFSLPAGSKDAVIVTTLQPGAYTAQISGSGPANTGVAILEVYDLGGTGQLVNIATRLQVGTGANLAVAGFVVAPGSGTRKLLVRGIGPALTGFGLPGALPDPRLVVLDSNSQPIAGAVANGTVAALASATSQAGAFNASAGDAATIVTVQPGSYTVQLVGNAGSTTGVGLIEVYDITATTGTPANLAAATPTLYYARLRPAAAAPNSLASGYATILFDPDTHLATVSVSFSNLTSATTSAHLVIDAAGSGNYVMNLPRDQASGLPWTFPAVGNLSSTDLINALQSGRIFVSIDSTNFPAGELQGSFIRTAGSAAFTAPAAPPALPAGALTSPTQTDAARFLTQATYGPTTATIAALQARGIPGWIDDQLAVPTSSLLAGLRADVAEFPNPNPTQVSVPFGYVQNLTPAWWKIVLTRPDQLRQRMAFALSEIFVIGAGGIEFDIENKAKYYDLLADGAFGNFRSLLEQITLSPSMGYWLSHIHNLKADPVKGTAPDENYAREVMQLFTIGLVQLQPDGTLMLDATGQPIPTYDLEIVAETAKILTGWTWANLPELAANPTNQAAFLNANPRNSYPAPLPDTSGWLVPMAYYDAFHDKTAKRIVSLQQVPLAQATRTVVPANQTGPQDLKILLDTLVNHPNTAPFLSRQLIQRFVTSNPSPGYVHRVAQVWTQQKDSPTQLGAVLRAILTDYEARSPAVLANFGYGKIKEPLLRVSAFMRILNGAAPNGRYLDGWFGMRGGTQIAPLGSVFSGNPPYLGQVILRSPTVFNFFAPDYSPPGPLAAAGLVAPELQIVDSYYAMNVPNQINGLMFRTTGSGFQPLPPSGASPYFEFDYSAFLPNAKNAAA
ncbi:MAG: DUF1800 family protein, partial [Opitutaceae bacterium]|nr:DUF1800 family protein [Opitutaceae bacterium]